MVSTRRNRKTIPRGSVDLSCLPLGKTHCTRSGLVGYSRSEVRRQRTDALDRTDWDSQVLVSTGRRWISNGRGIGCAHAVLVCLSRGFLSHSTSFFRHQARAALDKDTVWLAESTRWPYIEGHRAKNELVNTDATLYEAFDICYDYDVYGAWRATIAGAIPLKSYVELLRLQTAIYPKDFIKLRFVENHDQQRVSSIFRNDRRRALAWTGEFISMINCHSSLVFSLQRLQSRLFLSPRRSGDWTNQSFVLVREGLGRL